MIRIPNSVTVRIGIQRGSIYNFSPEKGVSNHYFVVINKDPKNEDDMFLVSFTSNKGNVLRFISQHNFDTKTCVNVEDGECAFLPTGKKSCVNCNYVRRYSMQKLIELIDESNGGSNYPKAEESLLDKIIIGVKASKMVAEDIKNSL